MNVILLSRARKQAVFGTFFRVPFCTCPIRSEATVIANLEYKGHSYFGQWFEKYDPKLHVMQAGWIRTTSFGPERGPNSKIPISWGTAGNTPDALGSRKEAARLSIPVNRQPAASAPAEKDPTSPRQPGWRVPRAVVDLVSVRPIDLAVIDGVKTMTDGDGPWSREAMSAVSPGVLIAGTNCVNTDAVAMAVMGYDPMADRGKPPFEFADSTLRLAEGVSAVNCPRAAAA